MRVGPVLMLALASCGASDEEKYEKQRQCDAIAADIRRAAEAKGQSSQGACFNEQLRELTARCSDLVRCNEELEDM